MKHDYSARLDDIRIRQLSENDIELLRQWRNNQDYTKFLSNLGYITAEMQRNWYQGYLENEQELVFAIEDIGELNRVVGSLALYDWDRKTKTCEIGKIQIGDPEAHGKGIGRKALVMAMKIAFRKLGVKKIVASVHPDNVQAYHNDMKVGFIIIGEKPSVVGGNELLLEIFENVVQSKNPYYDNIVV